MALLIRLRSIVVSPVPAVAVMVIESETGATLATAPRELRNFRKGAALLYCRLSFRFAAPSASDAAPIAIAVRVDRKT
jgi:hypothetical protein